MSPQQDEHAPSELAARSRVIVRRSIGSPILFTIVYSSLASAVYFSLGVIAGHALGLTPLVFLIAAVLYTLTAMTYVEGASLHQDRGGSTVFARYAFNELVSFIAGWAILLDYVILIAVTAYSATQYLKTFWSPLGNSGEALGLALAFVAIVVLSNLRGFSGRRARRVGILLAGDLALQAFIVVLGLALFFDPHTLLHPIHLGSAPKWSGLVFAMTVAVISFTSLESASGLAGEVRISRAGLKRLVASTTATVVFLYVGIALVAVTALPVHDGHTELATRYVNAPMIGIVAQVHPHWLAKTLTYVGRGARRGHARGGRQLRDARPLAPGVLAVDQPPDSQRPGAAAPAALDAVRADHPRRPDRRAALAATENLDFLIGIYAFGATLAFTIAHLSICRLRYTEPDRDRPYRVPLSVSVRGGELPLPAVFGALRLGRRLGGGDGRARTGALRGSRLDGGGDRAVRHLPPRRRDVAAAPRDRLAAGAARGAAAERDYGSVLVPLFGTDLDDDIVQTAALLVSGEPTDEAAIDAATIEALWVFVIPMSLPLDASLPEAQIKHARQVLARAKAVGEEYTGVQVATATVRTRRAGYAIVERRAGAASRRSCSAPRSRR